MNVFDLMCCNSLKLLFNFKNNEAKQVRDVSHDIILFNFKNNEAKQVRDVSHGIVFCNTKTYTATWRRGAAQFPCCREAISETWRPKVRCIWQQSPHSSTPLFTLAHVGSAWFESEETDWKGTNWEARNLDLNENLIGAFCMASNG
jgi:hypothetical protein